MRPSPKVNGRSVSMDADEFGGLHQLMVVRELAVFTSSGDQGGARSQECDVLSPNIL